MSKMRHFALSLLVCVPIPLLAHHSLEAQFNPKEIVTLKGTVTKVTWGNPHVHFNVDATDARGQQQGNWELEMASPNSLTKSGWNLNTLKPGDRVTVDAYRARDGSKIGYARSVMITGH